jgi:hypothetical protein
VQRAGRKTRQLSRHLGKLLCCISKGLSTVSRNHGVPSRGTIVLQYCRRTAVLSRGGAWRKPGLRTRSRVGQRRRRRRGTTWHTSTCTPPRWCGRRDDLATESGLSHSPLRSRCQCQVNSKLCAAESPWTRCLKKFSF